MRLDLIAVYLVGQGLGTLGVDLFVHRMPADVAAGILLRNPLDGMPIDWNLPGYHKHKIQAIVRANTQTAGDTKASQLATALTMYRRSFVDSLSVPKMFVQQLLPCSLPIVYPRSEKGDELEWSIDLDAAYNLL